MVKTTVYLAYTEFPDVFFTILRSSQLIYCTHKFVVETVIICRVDTIMRGAYIIFSTHLILLFVIFVVYLTALSVARCDKAFQTSLRSAL
jgi:hypothetical protein